MYGIGRIIKNNGNMLMKSSIVRLLKLTGLKLFIKLMLKL